MAPEASGGSRAGARIEVDGEVPHRPDLTATLRSRIITAVTTLQTDGPIEPFEMRLQVGSPPSAVQHATGQGATDRPVARPAGRTADERPLFTPVAPSFTLDQLALPEAGRERLLDCISFFTVAPTVFDIWGLRAIEPNPSMAVNFRGPPGTGKTMAGHAAAAHLGKKILLTRLSDLESKYHGDGPKNLVSLFADARKADAVLFIDEAESLLSRRFANPEQAAESAINSMRTELLMALDAFEGLVIFASNLPHSYDAAIESRLFHVDFELPTKEARRQIWDKHLPAQMPKSADVSIEMLSDIEGVSGRDIKLAVISAAVSAARQGRAVDMALLTAALPDRPSPDHRGRVDLSDADGAPLTDQATKDEIGERIRVRLVSEAASSE